MGAGHGPLASARGEFRATRSVERACSTTLIVHLTQHECSGQRLVECIDATSSGELLEEVGARIEHGTRGVLSCGNESVRIHSEHERTPSGSTSTHRTPRCLGVDRPHQDCLSLQVGDVVRRVVISLRRHSANDGFMPLHRKGFAHGFIKSPPVRQRNIGNEL